jgi:HPr kinase/phosphorylase
VTGQPTATDTLMHATCVAVDKRGLLIIGPSGSGKSALALQLIALGAQLVADDQTRLERIEGGLVAHCPPALSGVIEARGVGLIRAPSLAWVPVALVVDLGQIEVDRLPPHRRITLCEIECDLVHSAPGPHFPSALLAYMKGGRQA